MATTNKRFVAKHGLDNNNQTITNIGAAGTSLGLSGTGDLTIAVSGTATLTIPAGSDTLVTLSGAQTLTNKTISGSNNTLSNIGNGSLTNSSVSFNGVSVALGASGTLYTDDISEDGSPTNKYFTDARARAAISVTDSGGDGSLSYDNGTGVITYTGPSATEVRAHLSAGTGLTYTTGQFAIDSTVVTLTGTQTLENKTLTTPVISAITNTGTLTLPTSTDTLVGRATTDTLSNKTISGASNTISNIGNGSLTNSSITINGTSVSLGDTRTLVTDDIAFDEAKETVGVYILQALTPLLNLLSNSIVPAFEKLSTTLGPIFRDVLDRAGIVVRDILVPSFQALYAFIHRLS